MEKTLSFNERTYDSIISNPEPEPVFISREGHSNYIKAVICIVVDFFVTIFLIFVQYGLFGIFEEEMNFKLIAIISSIAFAFFACVLIFVITHITILVIISKYMYILVGGIYYGYRLTLMIIYLVKNEKGISTGGLIFFIIILATILPRVFGFYNIEILAKVCKKVDDNKRILEHEKFVEKIGNKIDNRHSYSRWSNTLEVGRTSRFSNSNINEEQDNKK